MKHTGALAFLLITGLVMTDCNRQPSAPETTVPHRHVIGMLLSMTEETPFFISLVKGAGEAADRLNVTLSIRYARDDPDLQSADLLSMIDDRVNALLVNPVSDAVVPAIEKAAAAGIPVFTIDRSAPSDTIICHIASDNLSGGRMAGEYLAEKLNRRGNVVELEGTPGSSAAHYRGAGFNQIMATYPDITVIARKAANFTRSDGKAVFAHILADYPKIDGVFAHNDDMILGAIKAAKEADRSKDIMFVGFDAIEEAIDALESGDLLATVAQRPAEMGRIGVEAAFKHLQAEAVPKSIPVDLALITK